MMRRRQFIALLGGATAAWPLGARAQRPANQAGIDTAYNGLSNGDDLAGVTFSTRYPSCSNSY